jgi:predicted NBD/HSP70 family sugar kinase
MIAYDHKSVKRAHLDWRGMKLLTRHRRELFEILARGPVSRTGLVHATKTRRNTVYDDIYAFLEEGLIREVEPAVGRAGRPRIPLEIDPKSRQVLGISFQLGRVEVGRFNLLGDPVGEPVVSRTTPSSAMRIAADLARQHLDPHTVAVGVSTPGFVDRDRDEIVFSVVFPDEPAVSLNPIREVCGERPTVIETEAHAVAARWLLTHAHAPEQDTLLIYFEDGSLGAAFIVHGRPNRGCISGANELGHTRLNVQTRTCYCGGVGCLERICDTDDLRDHGLGLDLDDALAKGMHDDPVIERMIQLLAVGFSNAINFTRAGHLIIASQLPHSGPLIERLVTESRRHMLPQLRNRVQIESWPEVQARSARTAAFLALTTLYYEDW